MERKFDKNFLDTQTINAKRKLKNKNITDIEKFHLEIMINKFTEYLENKKVDEDKKEDNFDENSYRMLNEKLNNDLNTVDLDFWKKIIILYNNVDQSEFENNNYTNIVITSDKFFDIILDFYKEIDTEYYQKALSIIQFSHSLINFDKNSVVGDECFFCEALKMPFINVAAVNDVKYIAFVHELQHGNDYLLKGSPVTGLLSELTPIFFESLFIDFLNKNNNCDDLYSFRINGTVNSLKWLNSYANILIRFDKCGRKVTKHNIKKILGVKNNKDLILKYEKYIKINFINSCKYVLAFFLGIQFRNEYYNLDKNEVIKKLKDYIFDQNIHIDFISLANNYNSYIEEIKTKQKQNREYQKTVNI